MSTTIFQKIGLFFYETIDRTGFLLSAVRSVPRLVRYAFYLFMVISLYVINTQLINLVQNELFKPILNSVSYFTVVYLSLVVFYESLINTNVVAIIEEKKEKQKKIKTNKLQWWRLRNMNMFYRFMFYIFLYAVLQQILILNTLLAMQNVAFSASEYEIFLIKFKQILHYFTFGYIIAVIALDYFVGKKRKEKLLKIKEFTNEE
jgi:hypothetical protein